MWNICMWCVDYVEYMYVVCGNNIYMWHGMSYIQQMRMNTMAHE